MTFRDDSEPAYFVMSMFFYAYVVFWSWDFTGFYKYAQERIARSSLGPSTEPRSLRAGD